MAIGGKGDPVEAAAKRIQAIGFQVEGEPMGALRTGGGPAQGLAEGIQTMVQGGSPPVITTKPAPAAAASRPAPARSVRLRWGWRA